MVHFLAKNFARVAIAHQAFTKHRRLRDLYHNRHFAMTKKRELFTSLILSRLLYGSETWVLDDASIKAVVHNGILHLYKRLLGGNRDDHLSDEEILHRTGLPSPTNLL